MDYVLFGMGYGATLMLLGWALRTYGPERKYREIDSSDIDQVIEQRNWVQFVQGLGGVIAICGSALVFLTFIVMLINPDDTTGGLTSIIVWGFLLVVVFGWCWIYFTQYGMFGIWSRETGYGFGSTPQLGRKSMADDSLADRPQPQPRVLRHVEPTDPPVFEVPTEPEVAAEPFADDLLETVAENDSESLLPINAEPEIEDISQDDVEAEEAPDEFGYDFGDGSDTTVPPEPGGRSEAIRRLRERQARTSRNQG